MSAPVAKRKLNAVGQSRKDRHIRLYWYVLKSEAWRSLSPNAKAVLLDVWQRHNGVNNGQISYATREAKAVKISNSSAALALNELIEHGFLTVTRASGFNVKTREARLWAITAEKVGDTPATKDFMRWQPAILETRFQKIISQSRQRDAQSQETRFQDRKRSKKRSTVPPAGPETPETHRSQSRQRDTSSLPGGGGCTGADSGNGNGGTAAGNGNAVGDGNAVGNANGAFADAVRAKVKTEGLSIAALAGRCGVGRSHLSNFLAGRRRLSPASLALLRSYAAEPEHRT